MNDSQWVRVKDDTTKHEYSTRVVRDGERVIDKPATDRFGDALPPKPHRPVESLTTDDGTPLAQANKAELIDQANRHQIDLGDASTKDEIVAKISNHEDNPA